MSSGRAPDVSTMTVVSANSGSCRIHSVRVRPSTSGMLTSDRTSCTAAPALCACRKTSIASRAPPTAVGLHAPVPSHLLQNKSVRGIVVHNQDARPSDNCRLDSGQIRRSAGCQLEAGSEVEGAPFSDLAFRPNTPAHQTDQTRRNGEPQAGSSVLASGGSVGLREGLERSRPTCPPGFRCPYR